MERILIGSAILLLISFFPINAQTIEWVKSAGGGGDDWLNDIVVDNSGNCYVAGAFNSDTIVIGTDTLINKGVLDTLTSATDILLIKYGADGNPVWTEGVGGNGNEISFSVTIDAFGNCYVGGIFWSPTLIVGLDTLTNAGDGDIFLLKYDADGLPLWARSAGSVGGDYSTNISVDDSGDCYVAGVFTSNTLIIGTDTLVNVGGNDIMIIKYDSSGKPLWARSAGGYGSDWAEGVALDSDGNSYVVGAFNSNTLVFGSDTLRRTSPTDDIFIGKYSKDGFPIWAKGVGGTRSDRAFKVVVDNSDNVYVDVYIGSAIVMIDTVTLTDAEKYNFLKYDSGGTFLRADSLPSGTQIEVDNSGNLYTFGRWQDKIVIANIDPNGFPLRVDSVESNVGGAIWAVNTSGDYFMVGGFRDSVVVGTDTVRSAGRTDFFIANISVGATDSPSPSNGIPGVYGLSPNYPNPFNPSTEITYMLPQGGPVKLSVYDILGREVITLVNERKEVGTHTAHWNAEGYPSGIYFYRLTAGDYTETKKMVLMK